jgi:hypothetical protein
MNVEPLQALLTDVKNGKVEVDPAVIIKQQSVHP